MSSIVNPAHSVTFLDIHEAYTYQMPLECSYSINDDMTPSKEDWIGLYRVGWSSINDSICKQSATTSSSFSGMGKPIYFVAFKCEDLPRDGEEMYQLCYISNGKMCGPSDPFQLKEEVFAADFVEMDDSPSMLIIEKRPQITGAQQATANNSAAQNQDSFVPISRDDLLNGEANQEDVKIDKESKLLKEITSLKIELQQLQISHQQVQNELKLEKDKAENMQSELSDSQKLKSFNQITENELKNEKDKAEKLQMELSNSQELNKTLKQRIEEFNVALKKSQTEAEVTIAEYKSRLEKKQMEIDSFTVSHGNDSEKLKISEQNLNELKRINSTAQAELDEFRDKEVSWKQAEKNYQQIIEQLQRDAAHSTAASPAQIYPNIPSSPQFGSNVAQGPVPSLRSSHPAPQEPEIVQGEVEERIIKCPYCDFKLPEHFGDAALDEHLLIDHDVRVCPMCQEKFPNLSEAAFGEHVTLCVEERN